MSEHIRNHEHHAKHEHAVDHEHAKHVEQQQAAAAEAAKAARSQENLAHIRELAEKHSQKSETLRPSEQSTESDSDRLFGMQHELKQTAYIRTLAQIRRKLPRRSRSFSKLIHNSTVDTISSVSARSVARPSGLLGGSICAFLGTSLLWYYSKHYGFRYNYSVMLAFFIGGFAIGLVLELLIWVFYSRKQAR